MKQPHCSFCGASRDQSKAIIVADGGVAICDECGVAICDECVNTCAGMILAKMVPSGPVMAIVTWPRDSEGREV